MFAIVFSFLFLLMYLHLFDNPPALFAAPPCVVLGSGLALMTFNLFKDLGPGVGHFVDKVFQALLDLSRAIRDALWACFGLGTAEQQPPHVAEVRRD